MRKILATHVGSLVSSPEQWAKLVAPAKGARPATREPWGVMAEVTL